MKKTHTTISAYNSSQTKADKKICELLRLEIGRVLKNSEAKIWHGAPVWFLDDNPIVGYSKQKVGIRLMFWSGVSFDEEELKSGTGKFKDASIFYKDADAINITDLKRWLSKAEKIQWDYKNIVKRKGRLERLK